MSGIKKLAGQTLWYGIPNIFKRFLGYALQLLVFRWFDPVATSDLTQVYAIIPFLNILFTYGLETSYFRFAQITDRQRLYNTLCVSMFLSSILFTIILFIFQTPVTSFLELKDHPQYVTWMILILFFDTLIIIPQAKLRLEERPRKYAFINMTTSLINVALVLFVFLYARKGYMDDRYAFPGALYDPGIGVGYVILANLATSIITVFFFWKEIGTIRLAFDKSLWGDVMTYSYPLIVVGFGGMINEMLSRVIYKKVIPGDSIEESRQLGIFGANYKLAVLITIFIQIFKMAAEPFFFNQSNREDARKIYARVMKFFVIACCFMFLVISLFLEFWKVLIASRIPEYAEGLHVVPILAMGAVFLGIYYNLAIWYKLTNKNMFGAYITLAGAAITIVLNIWWIPIFGYTGSAWATFICYAFMMVISFTQGQRHYPIPYAKKKLIAYLSIAALFYIVHETLANALHDAPSYLLLYYGSSVFFLALFALLILRVERKELERLPVFGRKLKVQS